MLIVDVTGAVRRFWAPGAAMIWILMTLAFRILGSGRRMTAEERLNERIAYLPNPLDVIKFARLRYRRAIQLTLVSGLVVSPVAWYTSQSGGGTLVAAITTVWTVLAAALLLWPGRDDND